MNSKVIFGVFAILGVLVINCEAQDLSILLRDKALVQRQIQCALDRGPCDIIGKQVKALLPEALINNCRRCTRLEAKQARQIIEFMQQNYPNEFKEILRHAIKKIQRG